MNARIATATALSTATPTVDQLILYINNTEGLCVESSTFGQGKSIRENIQRKIKRGVLDEAKLPKLFLYLTTNAAKQYARDFGHGVWHRMFPVSVRKEAAQILAERHMARIR